MMNHMNPSPFPVVWKHGMMSSPLLPDMTSSPSDSVIASPYPTPPNNVTKKVSPKETKSVPTKKKAATTIAAANHHPSIHSLPSTSPLLTSSDQNKTHPTVHTVHDNTTIPSTTNTALTELPGVTSKQSYPILSSAHIITNNGTSQTIKRPAAALPVIKISTTTATKARATSTTKKKIKDGMPATKRTYKKKKLNTNKNKKPASSEPQQQQQQQQQQKQQQKQERGIPFEEMRRLMEVYGSTKCLRKRQSANGKIGPENAKKDSVKRKFYRWFPDLEERFVKDIETGMYVPKVGHELEMQYREEMRKKDGEVLTKKRAKCRKQRLGGGGGGGGISAAATSAAATSAAAATAAKVMKAESIATPNSTGASTTAIPDASAAATAFPVEVLKSLCGSATKLKREATPSSVIMPNICSSPSTSPTPLTKKKCTYHPVSPQVFPPLSSPPTFSDQKAPTSAPPPLPPAAATAAAIATSTTTSTTTTKMVDEDDVKLEFDHDLAYDSMIIADTTEPIDRFFVADHGIFDDVEESLCCNNDVNSFVRDSLTSSEHDERGDNLSSNSMSWDINHDRRDDDDLHSPSMGMLFVHRDSSSSSSSGSLSENNIGLGGTSSSSSTSWAGDNSLSMGSLLVDRDSSSSSSGGSLSEGNNGSGNTSSSTWEDRESPPLEDILDKTMEEYCEEMLASADAKSGFPSGFHFDMISS